jgi:hypothetical protein
MQSSWSKKSHRFQIRLQNIFKRWNTENLLFRWRPSWLKNSLLPRIKFYWP